MKTDTYVPWPSRAGFTSLVKRFVNRFTRSRSYLLRVKYHFYALERSNIPRDFHISRRGSGENFFSPKRPIFSVYRYNFYKRMKEIL